MNSKTLEILNAQSEYVNNLKLIASDAAMLAKQEGIWDESTEPLLNFGWLSEKFKYFWFKESETEELVARNLPGITMFTPLDFEQLVQSVLWILQDKAYRETPVTGDGGIDLILRECLDPNWGAYSTTVVQCKLYRGFVPVSEIRDFFGVMSANTATGIFVTTGKFTSQTYSFLPLANASPHSNSLFCLELKEWSQILKLATEYHCLLKDISDDTESDSYQAYITKIENIRTKASKVIFNVRLHSVQSTLF